MPVNNGSPGSALIGPLVSTKYLLGQSPFVPPRVISGNSSSGFPADGRVTKELSPVRDLDGASITPPLRQNQMPTWKELPEVTFESIPEYDNSHSALPGWQPTEIIESDGDTPVPVVMQHAHTLPAQGSAPMGVYGPQPPANPAPYAPMANGHVNGNVNMNGHMNVNMNGNVNFNGNMYGNMNDNVNGHMNGHMNMNMNMTGDMNGNMAGTGPLPNPSFVFGDVHNNVDPMNNTAGNFGVDDAYLAMQDRSRLNSMASIGTFNSEAPTEMSDFSANGAFDYLSAPESYNMFNRRQSAPADLVDGLGMIGLNSGHGNGIGSGMMTPSGSGSGSGSQPIRPSPLGQTHSVSSDHVATMMNGFPQPPLHGYGGVGVGGGWGNHNPNSNTNANFGLGMSGHQNVGQGYDQGQGQYQNQNQFQQQAPGPEYVNHHAQTVEWMNNFNNNSSYVPMSSQTSNSTEQIFTPQDQYQQYQHQHPSFGTGSGSSSDSVPNQSNSNGNGSGNGAGAGAGAVDGSTHDQGSANGSGSGDDTANTPSFVDAIGNMDNAQFSEWLLGQSPADLHTLTASISGMQGASANASGNGSANVHAHGNHGHAGYPLAALNGNGNEYLASLNYADRVINEEDEDEDEDGEKQVEEGDGTGTGAVQVAYASVQVTNVLLEGR